MWIVNLMHPLRYCSGKYWLGRVTFSVRTIGKSKYDNQLLATYNITVSNYNNMIILIVVKTIFT